MSKFPKIEGAARAQGLLLASLVLNVLFVGAAGAVAFRYTGSVPLTNVAQIDRSVTSRLNRIAATLPPADAQIISAELRADAETVASAQVDLRLSREALRDALRAEPFDANAVRAAMATSRASRQNFDQVVEGVIAAAAAKMSVVGRNKLADWSATRGNATTTR